MTRSLRVAAVAAFVILTVSAFGQKTSVSGTVVDVNWANGKIQLELDDEPATRMTIDTDSVTTVYYGFGSMIADKPELFTGSKGLANVRIEDRLQVIMTTRADGSYKADRVSLLGREVEAPTVGVGETRDIGQSSIPMGPEETMTGGVIEGTVRQINRDEGRIVVQTPQRRMITVNTPRNTPVIYRGEEYRVANLETGDRIRVEAEPRTAQADEIVALRITVVTSVQESEPERGGGMVTTLEGRVSRTEPGLDYLYLDNGRDEIRVDMRSASDAAGDELHARDVRVGERVSISGSYNRVGDMFLASTLREITDPPGPTPGRFDPFERLAVMTISATVVTPPEEGPTITVRDRDTGDVVSVWVTREFVVRTRDDRFVTAATLRPDDAIVIDAFRDAAGNLIAQTIRLRNR